MESPAPFTIHGPWIDRWDVVLLLLVTLATVFLFAPSVGFGYINLDDPVYLLDNPSVLGGLTWEGLRWAFTDTTGGLWLPLTWVSYQAVISLAGPGPGPQHLVNVILHGFNAGLLYLLLRRATGERLPSTLAALLFAVHPTRVESVAWIAERKDVLSTAFGLLAVGFHLQHLDDRRPLGRWLCLLAFLASLLAKAMLVTLPLLLVLADYWPLRRYDFRDFRGDLAASLREKVPLFLLSLAFSLATLGTQGSSQAIATLQSHPLDLRLMNALRSTVQYLHALVWPVNLAVFYPYLDPGPEARLAWLLGAGGLLAVVTGAVLAVGRRLPYLPVGWLGFLVALLPVSGLIQAGSQARADRFTYLPFIGLFVMAAWGLPRLRTALGLPRALGRGAALAALAALALLTRRQLALWRDDRTLFEHAARVTIQNHLAHAQAGLALSRAGLPGPAAFHLFEAARIVPSNPNYAYLLGVAQGQLGQPAEAAASLARARVLGGTFQYLDFHLGLALALTGRYREAAERLAAFLADTDRRGPHDAVLQQLAGQARLHLGVALVRSGRPEEGRAWLAQVEGLDPVARKALGSAPGGVQSGRARK